VADVGMTSAGSSPRRRRLPRFGGRVAALSAAVVLTVVLAQSATSAAFTAGTSNSANQVTSATTFCTTPGTTTLPVALDTAVYQSNPNQNYGSGVSIGVGSSTGANAYSYLKFTLTSASIPANCRVTSATLWIYASTPMGGATLYAYRADASWSPATMTWNTGRVGFAGTPAQTTSSASAGWQQWDVTLLTRELYAGPDYGFALKDSVDNAATARYQTWSSMENTTVANRPKLDITWG
jgi:hypothetical protein